MVYLENNLASNAFTADHIAVLEMLASQAAISLENALLYEDMERRVQERTRQLREAQAELVATARQAGMAEIAIDVLHNVGNVLNSVNVSANVISQKVRTSKAGGLARAVQLMNEHASDLGNFLTLDVKGRQLPGYLERLAETLATEQQSIVAELDQLAQSIDHIKNVVATQQSYAGVSSVLEPMQISDLVEDALRMNSASLTRHEVTVVKEFAAAPMLPLDKHRILQILVNLISNAKHAVDVMTEHPHRILLRTTWSEETLRVSIEDNGEGIPAENLTRIFAHGFTTRKDGHGFGLHSCVLAARAMGGELNVQSDGPGKGATFTLVLPVTPVKENE
jgi:signal transduction histidine kinase